jgi:hypothetical protein
MTNIIDRLTVWNFLFQNFFIFYIIHSFRIPKHKPVILKKKTLETKSLINHLPEYQVRK